MLAKFNRLLTYSTVACLLAALIGCAGTVGSNNNNNGSGSGRGSDAIQLLYQDAVDGNTGTTTITAFRINSDGSLTSLGTALQTPSPTSLRQSDASGRHLFGSQFGSTPSIVTFSVNPDTGALQQTASLQPPAGMSFAGAPAVNPAGTLMFVSLSSGPNGEAGPGFIATYAIDPAGNLTPVDVPGLAVRAVPFGLIVNPARPFLYAPTESPDAATVSFTPFQIASNGSLTAGSTLHTDLVGGAGSAVTPNGNALYWGLYIAPQVGTLSVDPVTGNLTQGPTVTCACPFMPTVVEFGGGLEVNPQGTLLVEGTQGELTAGGGLAFYRIDPATGSLTAIPNTFKPLGSPAAPAFTFDRTGNFLYVTDIGLINIQGFAVSSDGALTPVPGSPFPQAGGGSLFVVNVRP